MVYWVKFDQDWCSVDVYDVHAMLEEEVWKLISDKMLLGKNYNIDL